MSEQRGEYENGEDASLAHLAQRLEGNTQFMASVLARHRRQEGKSPEAQQEMLGVDKIGYVRLALCHRPAADLATFHAQAEKIARYTGADIGALVQMIRRVDAVESMDPRTISPDTKTDAAGLDTGQPISLLHMLRPMAAARDRLSEDLYPYSAAPGEPPSGRPEDATPFAQQSAAEAEQPPTGGSESDHDAHDSTRKSPPDRPEEKPNSMA